MLLVYLLTLLVQPTTYLYVFFLGASLGSFLNVLAWRLPKGQSILGRSACVSCRHQLAWPDLIPLVSFIGLKGRCRYCRAPIGWLHPFFELVCGGILLLWFSQVKTLPQWSDYLILAIMLTALTLALVDYYYGIIPDELLLLLILLAFLFRWTLIVNFFTGGLLAALGFFALYFLSRGRAMGFGDVKYAFVMGLFLPLPYLGLAIYLAFLTGGIISVILILTRKKTMKSTISFGPFLSLGLIVSLWLLI